MNEDQDQIRRNAAAFDEYCNGPVTERIEAALKYAYCRGFAVGQVWKNDPRGEPFATAEYQWETCGRDYCVDAYENGQD